MSLLRTSQAPGQVITRVKNIANHTSSLPSVTSLTGEVEEEEGVKRTCVKQCLCLMDERCELEPWLLVLILRWRRGRRKGEE